MTINKRFKTEEPFTFNSWRDLTPMHTSVGSMLHNKTGSWRFIKPVFEDKTPACQNSCPAGNDIEGWLKLVQKGLYTDAYWHLKQEQPFPAILGRICFKFCETGCNRLQLDDAVHINSLEQFVGDQVKLSEPNPNLDTDNGKSLAIVGSGPAGMSNAYFARLLGFNVTIFESLAEMGGILRVGIPSYRLPREIVAQEFEGLQNMGITLSPGVTIGKDLNYSQLCDDFDYVFLATGVHNSMRLGITGENDSERISSGLDFLKQIAKGETVDPGEHVVVVGGGNTAIDAARTAVRLGAEVTVLHRRSAAEMPAHPKEIQEAKEEGVLFRFLAAPSQIDLHVNGSISKLICQEMELGPPDASGRRRPLIKEGSTFDVKADTVLNAIGESADLSYLEGSTDNNEWVVKVDESLQMINSGSKQAKVFAGGDIIDIPHTAVHAVAAGKKAAIAMDCDRRGLNFEKISQEITIGHGPALSFSAYKGWKAVNPVRQNKKEVVKSERMVFHYYQTAPPVEENTLSPEQRKMSFLSYQLTLEEADALREAERCLHCGRCMECDNCLVFCPDMSVVVNQDNQFGYQIDYDYCKGCGICSAECPRHAITMLSESTPVEEEV